MKNLSAYVYRECTQNEKKNMDNRLIDGLGGHKPSEVDYDG